MTLSFPASLISQELKPKKEIRKNQILIHYINLTDTKFHEGDGTFLYPKLYLASYSREVLVVKNIHVSPQIELGWSKDYGVLANFFISNEVGLNAVRWNFTVGSQTVLFNRMPTDPHGNPIYKDFDKVRFKYVQADITLLTGPTFKILNFLLIRAQVGAFYGRFHYSRVNPELKSVFKTSVGFEF